MIRNLTISLLGGLLISSQASANLGDEWYTGQVVTDRNVAECVVTNPGGHGSFSAYIAIYDESGNIRADRGPVNVPEFKSKSVSHKGSGIRWCYITTSTCGGRVLGRITSLDDGGMSVDGSEIQNTGIQNGNVSLLCP